MGNKKPMKNERVMFSTIHRCIHGCWFTLAHPQTTLVKQLFECEVAYAQLVSLCVRYFNYCFAF